MEGNRSQDLASTGFQQQSAQEKVSQRQAPAPLSRPSTEEPLMAGLVKKAGWEGGEAAAGSSLPTGLSGECGQVTRAQEYSHMGPHTPWPAGSSLG